jgi:threonylcarbamoyladenosine tRNA methylthiotransferase MtaB
MKRAFLSTLGCKVNQYETAAFKSDLEDHGIEIVDRLEQADLVIINTCTVTSKAGGESRREVRKALRRNHRATVVVTGCHAQLEYEELYRLPDIDSSRLIVAGNDRKGQLISSLLDDRYDTQPIPVPPASRIIDIAPLTVHRFEGRTRAYLRVQDGCESFCSYCIVPYARGRSRSLPVQSVLAQAAAYADSGHREIVVTGIHVGRYGADLSDNCHIVELLDILCGRFPGIRFRLSSIEPLEISDDLLALMADTENLMPHLHIPLQSGDSEILKRMNRRYSAEQYAKVVAACRSALPDAAIGVDVMVGFPGETEEHFNNSRNLIESVDCSYLHIFPYSRRPGTKAAEFANQVSDTVKQQRADRLRQLDAEKRQAFYRRFINTTRTALLETERASGPMIKGYTDNYIPIIGEKPAILPTDAVAVELTGIAAGSMTARIV